jgi:hypothetical protein
MAVRTPHQALPDLGQQSLERDRLADQFGYALYLIPPNVVKFQDSRIGLSTIHARVLSQVS